MDVRDGAIVSISGKEIGCTRVQGGPALSWIADLEMQMALEYKDHNIVSEMT